MGCICFYGLGFFICLLVFVRFVRFKHVGYLVWMGLNVFRGAGFGCWFCSRVCLVWVDLCVSFCVGCILLTKSLLCNVVVFIREAALSRVYSSAMSFKKILWSLEASLFRFPASHPNDVIFRSDTHQSATSIRTTRSFPSGHQSVSRSSSEFEKIPVFQCICPDDVVIPFGHHSGFDKH